MVNNLLGSDPARAHTGVANLSRKKLILFDIPAWTEGRSGDQLNPKATFALFACSTHLTALTLSHIWNPATDESRPVGSVRRRVTRVAVHRTWPGPVQTRREFGRITAWLALARVGVRLRTRPVQIGFGLVQNRIFSVSAKLRPGAAVRRKLGQSRGDPV